MADSEQRSVESVTVRPRKVRRVAWAAAVLTAALFTVVAAVLRDTDTGVYFRLADQVAVVVLGLLVAGGILLLARPRVRADAEGIEVRNTLTTRTYPWSVVRAVSFPDSASFARLELPADEYVTLLAIQAVDRQHAVDAITRVRALHAAATTRS